MLTAESAASTRPRLSSRPQPTLRLFHHALAPFTITRREPGAHDVLLEILYCGVCHSDIHQARGEWGQSNFPWFPGTKLSAEWRGLGPR